MIKTLIKAYHTICNKGRLATIEAFANEENFFRNEVSFFDDGRVISGIEAIKMDYAALQTEIKFVKEAHKKDKDYTERLNFLYGRQYECVKTMAFQASQNIKNIDNCLSLMEDFNDDFKLCLEGLSLYKNKRNDDAFVKFTEYFSRTKSFGTHYLLNKLYGTMLYEQGAYKEAEPFLYVVTQVCPEDEEVHKILLKIYMKSGKESRVAIEKEIISVLGGTL